MKPGEPEEARDTLESVTFSTFKVPGDHAPRIVRNWQEPNSYQLVVDLPQKQLEYSKGLLFKPAPTDRIPATPLGKDCYEMFRKTDALTGMRSRYAPCPLLSETVPDRFGNDGKVQKTR